MSTNESRVNRTCRRQTLSAEQRESDRQRALSAVNRVATRTFKEKKKQQTATKVKMSGSETKVNRNRYNISSTERVTRKNLEVSRCSHAK